ncbi:hypothetical protein AYI68_g4379 [Smittium mucronatum]|uniref:Uncharacterized protein n=1 Tax=Smittium mucronatum TaxID=133383 RepID=A0A1R0GX90_9FUNG|nr:hypothetical protein AYI68_g4379 [Smittium mucronatum]
MFRIENLHRGMNFIGKPEYVMELDVKIQMESKTLYAHIVEIKISKRARAIQPFRGHQQVEWRPSSISTIPSTAKIIKMLDQNRQPIALKWGFRWESGGEVVGAINFFNCPPNKEDSCGVEKSYGESHRKQVGH